MNPSTRSDRVQLALELRAALHRKTPGDDLPPGGTPDGPRGNCGRDATEICGMIDRSECVVHADPQAGDPETLAFAGTAAMRRAQLAERRRGSRL
jgi:hypothetical protein